MKCFRHNQNVRIIPTRMGTSLSLMQKLPYHEDHPHAYGDKKGMRLFCLVYLGSSPRVWGQGHIPRPLQRRFRIIPTRMGTRQIEEIFPRSSKDHPHAYGDKLSITWCSLAVIGSSPRVWGQVIMESVKKTYTGIIPTRMGTSLPPYGLCRSFRDHPHAYGDKKTNTVASLTKLGSSPRVWGQVKLPRMFSNANRIIPTRMGTS